MEQQIATSDITFADILFLFKENTNSMKENAENMRINTESMRINTESMRINTESMKENAESMKETDRKMKETDRKISQMSESIGRLGNRLGEFVEEMVRPAAVRLFKEQGIDVHEVHQNIISQRDGEGIEIDLLVVNDSDIIAIECKSNLKIDDVREHVKRLEKIKRLLPAYADKRVMGAVSAMVLADNVVQYAFNQGLFVIAQTGEHLVVCNETNFKAKTW